MCIVYVLRFVSVPMVWLRSLYFLSLSFTPRYVNDQIVHAACASRIAYSVDCTSVQGDGHDFAPITRFAKGELDAVNSEVSQVLSDTAPSNSSDTVSSRTRDLLQEVTLYGRVPTITKSETQVFRELASRHLPVKIIGATMEGDWSLETMRDRHADDSVTMVTQHRKNVVASDTTLGHFLDVFGTASDRVYKLSVREAFSIQWSLCSNYFNVLWQDFPRGDGFNSSYHQYNEWFQSSLPFPFITSANGIENFAAHWPDQPAGEDYPRMRRPDIGNSFR